MTNGITLIAVCSVLQIRFSHSFDLFYSSLFLFKVLFKTVVVEPVDNVEKRQQHRREETFSGCAPVENLWKKQAVFHRLLVG